MIDFDDDRAVAGSIQFTNVQHQITRAELISHVERCAELRVHAAMIGPAWVPITRDILKGTEVRVATTLNFPQANDSTAMKTALIPYIAEMGADEFDFPPNPGFLLSRMHEEYHREISEVVAVAHAHGLVVKAMLEFGYLATTELRQEAVRIACDAGIDWIKQSSGWGIGGIEARIEDVSLMRQILSPPTRIKVSGKVNSRAKMKKLFEAGAELVGTSSAIEIIEGRTGDQNAY